MSPPEPTVQRRIAGLRTDCRSDCNVSPAAEVTPRMHAEILRRAASTSRIGIAAVLSG